MNLSNDSKQINFKPFNFFNNQHQDMRDPNLNYFNDLSSNNFISTCVFDGSVKIYLWDVKKFENLSLIHANVRSINSIFEKLHDLL